MSIYKKIIVTCNLLCLLTITNAIGGLVPSRISATNEANLADTLTGACQSSKDIGKIYINETDIALGGDWSTSNMQTITNATLSLSKMKTMIQDKLDATMGSYGCGATLCEIDRLTSNLSVINNGTNNVTFVGGLNGDLVLRCIIGHAGNTCRPYLLDDTKLYFFIIRDSNNYKPSSFEVGLLFDPNKNLSEIRSNQIVHYLSSIDKCNSNTLKPMHNASATFASGNSSP